MKSTEILSKIIEIMSKYDPAEGEYLWDQVNDSCLPFLMMGAADRLYLDEGVMSDEDYMKICELVNQLDNPYGIKPTDLSGEMNNEAN